MLLNRFQKKDFAFFACYFSAIRPYTDPVKATVLCYPVQGIPLNRAIDMKRDINKLVRQKALQGDTNFFKSVSLVAFSSDSEKVDLGTVTVKEFSEDSFIEDCPEE